MLSHYLRNLSDLHIIVKETPYPEGSRRGIWRIEDLLFRFWYRYIPDNMSLIESGHADITVQLIMKDLPNYMGGVFEDICRQWLWANTATDGCRSCSPIWADGGEAIREPSGRRRSTSSRTASRPAAVCIANANGAANRRYPRA